MAKTKEQKKQILDDLNEKIKKSKAITFINFNALGVNENQDIRKKVKEEKGEYYVSKKTLLNLAFKNSKMENLIPKTMDGKIAAIFSYDDEVAPTKVIGNFMKEKENEGKIEFLGGILDNKLISAEESLELTKIPSKDELYAKLVGSINAPISGFVNCLAGSIRNLVYVLKAIEEKK